MKGHLICLLFSGRTPTNPRNTDGDDPPVTYTHLREEKGLEKEESRKEVRIEGTDIEPDII